MRANEFLLDPNVEEFLEGLTPDDVGVDEVGDYIVHYEGFTDQCQDSEEYQNNPDAVFNDVWGDFKRRMGDQDPINYGLVGSEDYPIVYSVFKNSIKESKSDDQVAENFADGEIKESKETRQALSDQHFEFPQQGQYGYRTGYQGRGVLELADGRTGKIINLGEFGDFDDEYKPNQKWLRIVFTNPNMDDNAWNELEDMLWSDDQVAENFADGKGPGRPGDSQRHGISKGATMAELEKAAKASGRKGQLARWQINMRRGKKK